MGGEGARRRRRELKTLQPSVDRDHQLKFMTESSWAVGLKEELVSSRRWFLPPLPTPPDLRRWYNPLPEFHPPSPPPAAGNLAMEGGGGEAAGAAGCGGGGCGRTWGSRPGRAGVGAAGRRPGSERGVRGTGRGALRRISRTVGGTVF